MTTFNTSRNDGDEQQQQDRYFVTIVEDSIAPLLDSSSSCATGSGAVTPAAKGKSSGGSPSASILNLEDPSGDSSGAGCCERRPYVVLRRDNRRHDGGNGDEATATKTTTTTICEFQRISKYDSNNCKQDDYASFIVAGHVIGKGDDNAAYALSPVDPLFWVLQKAAATQQQQATTRKEEESDSHQQQPWQPLDQIIDGYFGAGSNSGSNSCLLRDAVDRKQLLHFLDRIDIGCGEYCYRFSEDRALRWLRRKQEAVRAALLQHEQQSAARTAETQQHQLQDGSSKNGGGGDDSGAFSSCFELPAASDELVKAEENQRPSNSTAPSAGKDSSNNSETGTELLQASNEKRAKAESAQIVCSYLNEYWAGKFLRHLDMSPDILLTSAELKARSKKQQQQQQQCDNNNNKRKLGCDPKNGKQEMPSISQDWNHSLQQPVVSSSNDDTGSAHGNNDNSSTSTINTNNKKLKPDPKYMSVGAKRLAKVNTKGMKKLSNFFTAKKKKT